MKFIKRIITLIIIFGIGICGYITYTGYNMYKNAIAKISIEDKVESVTSQDGYVKFEDIPTDFSNAIVAIEDHRFYKHGPVDIFSIGRAVVKNIKDMALSEGGSTISQQVGKNLFFTQEKKFERKVAEVFVAYDLEKKYSKNEILALYINTIYYGDGYIGLSKASMGYFNKIPKDLNLEEITILAGIPNAPSVYALSSNPELAKQRQYFVIDAMYKYNYLTENQVNSLKND